MAFSFKTLFKKSDGPKTKLSLVSFDALADWKKIVYFASFLFAVSLLWSGYLFWSIQSGKPIWQGTENIPSKSLLLNVKALQAVSSLYIKKGEAFGLLLTNVPPVVDPAR